jgi:hypothetical protein
MKIVFQTNNKNCFASCVASILECDLSDIDVNVDLLTTQKQLCDEILKKEKLKGFGFVDVRLHNFYFNGVLNKTFLNYLPVGYCIVSFSQLENQLTEQGHSTVGFIDDNRELKILHNPTESDHRKDEYMNGQNIQYTLYCL